MTRPDLVAASSPHAGGFREIDAAHARAHLGSVRVIDVRERDEFHGPLGHIPQAELVPLATVAREAARWDRAQPLLIVCRSGGRSARAAAELVGLGFAQVFNLTGGMLGWDGARVQD